ncbi:uncharacterized protein LY89DRAFT_620399 [Mollisia scopiformis]|uniref:Serine hydrolase domain-containing protein n=1 Tax=Mollisia scopiformis TaxID=149040 RepID=A0A194X4I3_MOLSC|nr:uncharacterized protein LY89DRAFT_620399 [Mollisia scopiformis]KUJ15090.1 hypothetical protein LY89DRAFT_620399 [Mollisia scopiformis]
MHFLCLHGRGTNAKLFEMQTAAIRYELGDRHTFDFVEGNMPYDIDPNVKSMLAGDEKTWAYFQEDEPKTALKAINDLDAFVEAQGPYDGVISFSQACGLVATWIIHRMRQGKLSVRCAIFLSAGSPAVDFDSLKEGNVVVLPQQKMGGIIDIPTAHVWGLADPYAEVAHGLSMLCRSDVKSEFIHEGGHEVPGAGSKEDVTSIVNIVRRTTLLAQA